MRTLEKTDIQLGYIPLLDCVAILWANHQGYFAEQGLNVTLVQEPSWASLRDRLAFGFLDAAHCLSAMLPAAATGEDQLGIPLQSNLVLSTNRAYISLSQTVCHDFSIHKQDSAKDIAIKVTQAIQQGANIQLAHVYKQSIHHYCLREWLALGNKDLAKDYRLLTLPPPYMVDAISTHIIDGFCVGEPWNTQAEIEGYSQIIAQSSEVIPKIADKVLATTQEWAITHPNTLKALQSAIQHAQNDISILNSLESVWQLLEQSDIIRFSCSSEIHVEKFHSIQASIRSFGTQDAIHVADFEWIIQQMCKWDNLQLSPSEIQKIAQGCIVPNI